MNLCSLKASLIPHNDAQLTYVTDIIPVTAEPPRRPRKRPGVSEPTMLDQFMAGGAEEDEGDGDDIVMNEDGTMYAAGAEAREMHHEFE